jgi:hypothetical protein
VAAVHGLFERAARFHPEKPEDKRCWAKSREAGLNQIGPDEEGEPIELRRDPEGQGDRDKDHQASEEQNGAIKGHLVSFKRSCERVIDIAFMNVNI